MSTINHGERLHALDAVRAFALLLGVALHTAMSFVSGFPIWITQDVSAAEGFSLAFYIPHVFRMVLFFFIAGFFARLAFKRRGLASFVTDRIKRIALPFAAFWFPVFASITAVVIWGYLKANNYVVPEDAPPSPPFDIGNLPLTHLWFLYLLLVFYAGMLILRAPIALLDRSEALRRIVDRILAPVFHTPLAIAVLATPLALVFLNDPAWMHWFGIPTPDFGWIPNNAALVGYGVAFGAGWLVHRQIGVLESWKRLWPINLLLAVGATALCLNIAGLSPAFMPLEAGQDKMVYAFAYAMGGWAWTIGLTGLALSLLSRPNKAIRYTADASYWIYLLHLPIVMALQVAVSDIAINGVLKFALINVVTIGILLASYHLLVRRSWLGGWLNGRRHPKADTQIPRRSETPEASPSA